MPRGVHAGAGPAANACRSVSAHGYLLGAAVRTARQARNSRDGAMRASTLILSITQRDAQSCVLSACCLGVGGWSWAWWGHDRAHRGLFHHCSAADHLIVDNQPLTAAGRVVDVALEAWAIFVVTAVAGSFASFSAPATPANSGQDPIRGTYRTGIEASRPYVDAGDPDSAQLAVRVSHGVRVEQVTGTARLTVHQFAGFGLAPVACRGLPGSYLAVGSRHACTASASVS